jgi:hypothetical protein
MVNFRFLLASLFPLLMAVGCERSASEASPPQSKVNKSMSGDSLAALPNPDVGAISRIKDSAEWRNPYIVVYADGYGLMLNGRPRAHERLNLGDVERALHALSLQAWPLGRVVAVSEIGLRSPGDDKLIAPNLDAIKKMLESHSIRVELWPSA